MSKADGNELEPLEAAIASAWQPSAWQDAHVVLAVSGGADSVAMLRAMLRLKKYVGGTGRLHVGHLHHGLRGDCATVDEVWLTNLCERLGTGLEIGRVDVAALSAEMGDGIEAAAREARYAFLLELAERVGARYAAVAHSADDQIETVLHRILRGTGLAGLTGIPFARPLSKSVTLVRPLLEVRRADVLRYLADISQDYRTDETNIDPRHTRNRLRHELLPLLREQFNRDVDEALRRLAVQARDAQEAIDALVEGHIERNVHFDLTPQESIRVDCRALEAQPPFFVREVFRAAWKRANWPLQDMRYRDWKLLADVATGAASILAINLPGNVRGERLGTDVTLRRLQNDPSVGRRS